MATPREIPTDMHAGAVSPEALLAETTRWLLL